MSLKDSIDNTNTQKNKFKKGKQNIDYKLVELGGEKSIDLNDVPIKMDMLIKDYSKTAQIERIDIPVDYSSGRESIIEIPLNLQFIPKVAFLYTYKSPKYAWVTSLPNFRHELGCNINYSFTKEKMTLKITSFNNDGFYIRGLFLVG